MKRILIFSTAYFPHVGGAEVAIKEIAERLAGDYDFDLICARYERGLPSKERIGSVNVYRIGVGIRIIDKLMAPFLGALLALRLARGGRYAAYWAMMATYGSGGAYLANMLQRPRVPVVLTLQEGDPPEYLRRKWFGLVGLSWRLALQRSQAVTVISSYLGSLAKEFGYRGEPILIPNGVDLPRFARAWSETERAAAAASLGKKEGDVFLVTTSRLVTKNAVDDVIRALALLPERVSFLVYGIGPDREKLEALARELGVTQRVRFMGQASHEELPRILSACDLFIRPSRSEGMGNSFIEAMAAGLPVIATQEGGIADFLFDEARDPGMKATGFAVDRDNPGQIKTAVEAVLADPLRARRIALQGKELAVLRYGWDRVAGDMREVFRRLVG